MDLELACKELE